MTLTAIVILYLSCNTPRLLLNCVEYNYFSFIMDSDFCECNTVTFWFDLLLSISRLCLVINSSANILIYFSISSMFKKRILSKMRLTRGESVKTFNKKMKVSISCAVLPNMSDIDKGKYADAVERKQIPCAV